MKLFKKKIIIYRETSFLSDIPNKYFFFEYLDSNWQTLKVYSDWSFVKVIYLVYFLLSLQLHFKKEKIVMMMIWWLRSAVVYLGNVTYTTLSGVTYTWWTASPPSASRYCWGAERNEPVRNSKSHHSVLNFVTWLPVLCSFGAFIN